MDMCVAPASSPAGLRGPEAPAPLKPDFDTEWSRCAGWIEDALLHARGTHSLDDVRAQIDRGDAVFWPGKRSAAVTEFIRHPSGVKQMHMWLCGGDLEEIAGPMLQTAEAYGILNGCTRFSTAGRKGWSRVLKAQGYDFYLEACLKDLVR